MKQITLIITGLLLGVATFAQQNVTIYQIQGQQDHSPYEGQMITTSGIVTATFGPGFFIQDGAGEWNGIYVYTSQAVSVGDDVTLTGEVAEYYDLTEIKNVSNITVNSSANPLPEPYLSGTWDVNDESLEGVLVRIESAICTNPDLGYGEWELDDGSGPCRVDDLGIVYQAELGITYAVTGPLYYSFEDYKILPRDESDIQILESLYFVEGPEQTEVGEDHVTLSWKTNVAATTEAFFGISPDDMQSSISVPPGDSINHEIEIPMFFGQLINYVRPFSVSGEDTTKYKLMVCALISGSTGEMKVLFNHDVDQDVAINEPAAWTASITDSVIAFLDVAQQTLDITMYEQESGEIVQAINAAYDRGVQIRYITDDIGTNPALENLNPNIPVLYGNTEAIMHNKFIVMDVADEMNCWVMTGSLNHTHNNLGWDYNNVICIQDQALAESFTLEFEEMWGSDGPMYDEAVARFGAEKTDNTPHKFLIGGVGVELYFSPSDGTTGQIVDVLNEAQSNVEFGMMVFTENSLGNAVLDAHQRGLDVTGLIDYVEYNGSEYDYLKSNGVYVRDYVNPDGTSWPDGPVFHHKYMIADFEEGSETAVLVTGSHNWSASAESINDENTLIIHNLNIANQFHQEFTKRFNDQLTPVAMYDDTVTPANTAVMIDFLANDFIPEDVSVSKEIITEPEHGVANMQAAGDFIDYFPEGDYIGYDSLSYRIVNSENPQLADTAWIKIKVGENGVYGYPFAMDDDTLTQINTSLEIHFLENDSIPENMMVQSEIIEGPYHGQALISDDIINYEPTSGYVGFDSLIYVLINASYPLLQDTAQVMIKVGNVGIDDIFNELYQFYVSAQNQQQLMLFVKSPDQTDAEFKIYDQFGRLLFFTKKRLFTGENRFHLHVADYSGICFVEINAKEIRKVRKVILK